jgi:uncharacterized membrane protein HdeD (DUF308 family)
VISIILGVVALGSVVATTAASAFVLGILVVIAGFAQLVGAFSAGSWGSGIARAVVGILYVIGGWWLITQPLVGAVTLTLIIGVMLVVVGIARLIIALVERLPGWPWWVVGGVASAVLGGLLLAQWPVSGLFAIGLFIGLDLIIAGVSWIVAAILAPAPAEETHVGAAGGAA